MKEEQITVVKVSTRKQMNDFIGVPSYIYKDCEQYVPDMEYEIRGFFSPKTNPGMEFSDIQAFVAYRSGKAVGRVAGIINHHANEWWERKNARFSMLEFVDDPEVSKALFDALAEWGREAGMKKLQGPMGISDFDKEGMLVEDFHLTGSMTAYYNPDYYPRHMERLGFRKEVDWLQVRIDIPKEVPAKYARVAQYAREMVGLKVVKVTPHQVLKEGYGEKIFNLLNIAYAPLFGFSPLTPRQIRFYLEKFVPMLDTQLVPIIENDKGELVGIAITLPSLTRALQKSKGRLWPLGWYHLLRSLKWKHEESTEMLLIAIHPEYQGLGVNAMFFDDLIPIYNRCGYKWAETGPQLEDNGRELSQWKPLKPQLVKRRRCFVKEIETK